MSKSIIHTATILRQLVIGQVQAIPEQLLDVQPDGFNNTIRWNVGHLIYWLDAYASLCFASDSAIPQSYAALFNSGTKPADWAQSPPSREELIGQLSAQLNRIVELSPEQLDRPLQSPFVMGPFRFETAGELFNFACIHEAIHLGVITSQLKAVQTK